MNYFYDLPDDIITKILDRKNKLERIDELKKIIDTFDVPWGEEFVVSNISYEDLKYDLLHGEIDELWCLEMELEKEDQSGFSYNGYRKEDYGPTITLYDTSSEEEDEE